MRTVKITKKFLLACSIIGCASFGRPGESLKLCPYGFYNEVENWGILIIPFLAFEAAVNATKNKWNTGYFQYTSPRSPRSPRPSGSSGQNIETSPTSRTSASSSSGTRRM